MSVNMHRWQVAMTDRPQPATFTFTVYSAWPPLPRAAFEVDYAMLELRLVMAVPMNEPHRCTHEGPWTLHSCEVCDIREGKLITALFAWLLDDKTTLDQVRPLPYVMCLHPGATVYEQCKTCRELHYVFKIDDRRSMFAKYKKYKQSPQCRQNAKRSNFGDILGPYGGGR